MPKVPSFIIIDVLDGISPLYLYTTFPAYTSPSGWLLNHAVPSNAPLPMLVTLLGMMMEVRPEQQENAPFSMLVTLLGMVMEVRPEQLENA